MSWLSDMFGGGKKQTIGFKYFLGMHMIAGHGNMDACEKIRVGEKVVWTPSSTLKDSVTDLYTSIGANPQTWLAQTFTASSNYTLTSVSLRIFRTPTQNPGLITVIIRTVDVDGRPTGGDLCTAIIEEDDLVATLNSSSAEWEEAIFNTPILLESGTKYAIIIHGTESDGSDSLHWCANTNNYSGGNAEQSTDGGNTWIVHPSDIDFCFKTYQLNGTPPNHTIFINKPNIFGGDKKEGGVVGNVDFMFGASDQVQNSYLIARHDSDIPAFRGLWSAVLNQVYIGTSPYLKPWNFFLKRSCKQISGEDQWYKEKAVIRPREENGDDLNPAHIIRECLIDSNWGLKFDADTDLDDNYFKETANVLYDEEFGLSLLWDQITSVEDFINEILDCIKGVLYQDLESGKWILELTRDPDYDNPYDYYNTGDNNAGSRGGSDQRFAQTFITSKNYKCDKIKIKIYESAGATVSNVKIEIQGTDADGHPDGNILTSGIISGNDISTEASWVEHIFSNKIDLITNTKYALVVYPLGIKVLYWRVNTFSSWLNGTYESSTDGGVTWSNASSRWTNDFMFEIYAGGDLETFNEDDIIEIEDFVRPTQGEVTDVVTINWWDKLNNKSIPSSARDIALIEKQGGAIIEHNINYYGICNATLANEVAERELKLATSMLAGMRIRATRKMAHLKPNDIFILSWDNLGIVSMVVRILNVNYGNLDKNEILLQCVEDVFSTAATIYEDSPETLWTDPISDAVDITNLNIIEIPYYALIKELVGSITSVDALDNNSGFICIVAEKPSEDSFDYDIYARLSASYNYEDVGIGDINFTPTATITNDLIADAVDTTIDLTSESDLSLVEENTFAIINEEIIEILTIDIDAMTVEIARGILDTVPASHSAGDIIYFMSKNYGSVDIEYTDGDQPRIKLLPRTGTGSLDITDATEHISSALDSRIIRPYNLGNLKFNSESYPIYFSTTATGKLAITWNHRDRTDELQLNSLVKHTYSSDIGPEAGTTYTIKIYNKHNVLKRTVTSLSGVVYNYTEAFEISDCGELQGELRFIINSVRDGYDSWQSYNIRLQRTCQGTVSATSNVSGSLRIENRLNGLSSSTTYLSTTLRNVTVLLAGLSSSITSILSTLRGITILLSGSISKVFNVSGSLNSQTFVGSVIATSNVSGTLYSD